MCSQISIKKFLLTGNLVKAINESLQIIFENFNSDADINEYYNSRKSMNFEDYGN